jgi:hypothetical protein
MANLKDQIQQEIRKQRERSERPGQTGRRDADRDRKQLDEIRPRLDELSHTADKYSLKVGYAVGPYSADIATVELYDRKETWVASWQVATTVGGSTENWEVTHNPHGVETQHEWFRDSDGLFNYLTASIAERIVEMEADIQED